MKMMTSIEWRSRGLSKNTGGEKQTGEGGRERERGREHEHCSKAMLSQYMLALTIKIERSKENQIKDPFYLSSIERFPHEVLNTAVQGKARQYDATQKTLTHQWQVLSQPSETCKQFVLKNLQSEVWRRLLHNTAATADCCISPVTQAALFSSSSSHHYLHARGGLGGGEWDFSSKWKGAQRQHQHF